MTTHASSRDAQSTPSEPAAFLACAVELPLSRLGVYSVGASSARWGVRLGRVVPAYAVEPAIVCDRGVMMPTLSPIYPVLVFVL